MIIAKLRNGHILLGMTDKVIEVLREGAALPISFQDLGEGDGGLVIVYAPTIQKLQAVLQQHASQDGQTLPDPVHLTIAAEVFDDGKGMH